MLELPFPVCLARVLASAWNPKDCSGPGLSNDVRYMEVVLEERAVWGKRAEDVV